MRSRGRVTIGQPPHSTSQPTQVQKRVKTTELERRIAFNGQCHCATIFPRYITACTQYSQICALSTSSNQHSKAVRTKQNRHDALAKTCSAMLKQSKGMLSELRNCFCQSHERNSGAFLLQIMSDLLCEHYKVECPRKHLQGRFAGCGLACWLHQ